MSVGGFVAGVIAIQSQPLSVDISPNSLNKFGINCPQTTNPATATGSGGSGGYSYAWNVVSGPSITINSASSAVTTFTNQGDPSSGTTVVRVVVTDSDLDTAEDTMNVDIECGT